MKFGFWTIITCVSLTVAAVACAQEPSTEAIAQDPVVAKYGDQEITQSELEGLTGPSLVALRQQIYKAQVAQLEAEIYARLVRDAAAAEGVTEA
ncbi:MAG: hypothetical protein P8127_17445, partial [Acidobacteriota bacterium]